MRHLLPVLATLLLLLPGSGVAARQAYAQRDDTGRSEQGEGTPKMSTQTLSLAEAWRLALENNLTLRQHDFLILQGEEEVAVQRAAGWPSLSGTGSYGYTSEVASMELASPFPGVTLPRIEAGTRDRYDAALLVEQPLFTGFRIRNQIRAAEENLLAQSARRETMRNQILLQVGQLFLEAQRNELQQQVLEQAAGRARDHLARVRSFYNAGQATAFDTLEVSNRGLQLRNQLQKLMHLRTILVSRLGHLLNAGFTPEIEKAPVEAADLTIGDMEEYQDLALRERPELKEIESLQRGQSSRMKALKSSYFPQLYASASYHYARPGVNFFRDEWQDYYTGGLNLRWQLWNWKQDKRQVQKARLEYDRMDMRSSQLLLDVRQQVTEAYQQLITTRQQIELERELVKQERERYRITLQNYEQANATSLDLSMAESTLSEAELTLRENQVEWLQNKLQLQFATGRIGKESLGG